MIDWRPDGTDAPTVSLDAVRDVLDALAGMVMPHSGPVAADGHLVNPRGRLAVVWQPADRTLAAAVTVDGVKVAGWEAHVPLPG